MNYYLQKRNDKEEGFTLIELVIVIAIMGILMTIAIPSYMTARRNAAINASKANLHNLAMALRLYVVENNLSTYPDEDDINTALPPYLSGGAPKNPGGNSYQYSQIDGGNSFLIGDPDHYGAEFYAVGPSGNIQILSSAVTGTPIIW